MIILAHDGSIYGDWVAHYALRFAADEADRKLLVLNVLDGNVSPDVIKTKFAKLEKNCQEAGVEWSAASRQNGPSQFAPSYPPRP